MVRAGLRAVGGGGGGPRGGEGPHRGGYQGGRKVPVLALRIMNTATYPCVAPGAKGHSGGFLEAACGARGDLRRAERQRAVAGRERSGEEAAREHLAPGGETPPGVGPIRDRNYKTQH